MEETIKLVEGTEENPIIEITREILDTTDIPEAIPTKITKLVSLSALKQEHKILGERIELMVDRREKLAVQISDAEELVAEAEELEEKPNEA